MKLAYISGARIPSACAHSVHAMHMAEAMADAGVSVTLYGMKGKKPKNANIYNLYGVKPNFRLGLAPCGDKRPFRPFLKGTYVLFRVLLLDRPNVCYGRDAKTLTLLASMGKKVWFEAQALPETTLEKKILSRLFRAKNFRGIVSGSTALAQDLHDTFPELKSKKTLVAPAGAMPQRNEPPKPDAWQGREGHPQIGYIGSLDKGRGTEMIINLANLLPEMDFHLIGGDAEQVSHALPENMPANLYFHGMLAHAAMPAYLSMFDITLAPFQTHLPTQNWMSPVKLFEYMAAGKPIICSDMPVLHEILEPNNTALFVKPDQTSEWVDAICYLVQNPSRMQELGARAKDTLERNFTWEKRARNILAFIK